MANRNRITSCNNFGCMLNPFYVLDRLKDPYQSSSGIDINPYEFNRYENFNENTDIKNSCDGCSNNVLSRNTKIIIIAIVLIFVIFIFNK